MQAAGLIIFGVVVVLLLWLDRAPEEKVSHALWIPLLWVLIIASRSPSVWLGLSSSASQVDRYSEGTPLDAALFALLIASGLVVLNRRARGIGAFLSSNAALLLFFGYCILSAAWSDSPMIAAKHLVKAVGDLVMALVVLTDRQPQEALRRLCTRAATLLQPASLLLIVAFPAMGSIYEQDTHLQTWCGVTTQKNELGVDCLFFGLAAVWALMGYAEEKPRRQKRMAAQALLLVLSLVLLVKCNSITSFSCLTFSVVTMLATGQAWVKKRPQMIQVVMGGALSLALFALFLDNSGMLLRMLGRNPTLTGRTEIWRAVLSIENNPWIGTGYDSFWLDDHIRIVAQRIGYEGITEAHNGYLELFINLGWIGVALVLWVLGSAWMRAAQRLQWHPLEGRWSVALVVANVVFNLSEAGIKKQSLIWLGFLLAAVEIPLQNLRSRPLAGEDLRPLGSGAHGAMKILR